MWKFHKKRLWPFYPWMNKDSLIAKIEAYRLKKGWDKTDTPHNLAKSIFVESAELLECFINELKTQEDIEYELADVLMYAISLANDLDLDIEEIIEKKWEDVDKRYKDVD